MCFYINIIFCIIDLFKLFVNKWRLLYEQDEKLIKRKKTNLTHIDLSTRNMNKYNVYDFTI